MHRRYAPGYSNAWHLIYAEFFPASEYRPVNGIDIEAYYEGNMDDEKYISEIWIPVERK